jgi:Chromate resistance exported protein
LTALTGFAVIIAMGVLRSPREATCPSIASRFVLRGRIHVNFHHDIIRQTCAANWHSEHPAARGRTVRIARARSKIDRIACPWLIRGFIDPAAHNWPTNKMKP